MKIKILIFIYNKDKKMLIEINNDLFEEANKIKDNYLLVQCMNQTLNVNKGIVVEFEKRYNLKDNLLKLYNKKDINIGDCLIYKNTANLITKHYVRDKPNYENLTLCLNNLKKYCELNNIKTLIMPKIGCGLDRLNWNYVKSLLNNIFNDYNIIVCYL